MLSPDTRIQPNSTDVAAKVIDGEAIIMNLANGLYFSMEHVGAAIWELAEGKYSIEEMVQALEVRCGADRKMIEEDVTRLVGELVAEGLVLVTDNGSSPSIIQTSGENGLTYTPPVLNKYSDMADILALDPPMPGLGESTWDG